MTLYCLQIRNTDKWDDVRYRAYTTSSDAAERFRKIPKIQFTDSGHGLVPTVHEHTSARKMPNILTLNDYVQEEMKKLSPPKPKRPSVSDLQATISRLTAERDAMREVLADFWCVYADTNDPTLRNLADKARATISFPATPPDTDAVGGGGQ